MRTLSLFLLALLPELALSPSAESRADEVDLRLAQLAAPEGEARHRAERWLAAHVGVDDVEVLARAARDGDAEVRRRIGRIVAAADADLRMSTAFLTRTDPALREIGELALRASITRWAPDAGSRAARGNLLGSALDRTASRAWPETLRLVVEGSLGDACALLARHARLPVGLAIDPEVADRSPSSARTELVGSWDELARRLASLFRVGLEGHDMNAGALPGAGPAAFLRFCQANEVGETSTADVLVSWVRMVIDTQDLTRRTYAARALAGSGWPAALAWLASRHGDGADEAALEGLFLAAADGRVSPYLERPRVLGALIERAGADLASGETRRIDRALRTADALRRLSCLGPDATSRADLLTAGWDPADTSGCWLGLVLLEALGCREGATPAGEVLARPDLPRDLRLQALRTWVAVTAGRSEAPTSTRPGDPASLLGAASVPGALEAGRLLTLGGFEPPAAWGASGNAVPRDDRDVPLSGRAQLGLLAWDLGRGDTVSAAALWRRLAAGPEQALVPGELTTALRSLARSQPDRLPAAWLLARQGAPEPVVRAIDRAALVAGGLPPARAAAVGAELLAARSPEPDLEVLSALAGIGGGSVSQSARQRLAVLLSEALAEDREPEAAEPLVTALEHALQDLERRGLDLPIETSLGRGRTLVQIWRAELLYLLRTHRDARLRVRMGNAWPPPPDDLIRDLATLDRRPGR